MFYLLLLRKQEQLDIWHLLIQRFEKLGYEILLLPWFSHWFCKGTFVYTLAKEGNICTISITPVSS